MTATGGSNKRISDLLNDVDDGRLVTRPQFQRRLVWTNVVKDKFLETVLKGLPFPEIFIATGQLDTQSMHRVNWLVDGQQRMSTLQEYVKGSKDLVLKLVLPYAELSTGDQTQFLDYIVAVRDLGTVTVEQIKEIFSRINSTDYALKRMEKLNALFSGEYKTFCEDLSVDPFFDRHNVFTYANRRRMDDVTFCVILVTTLLSTYYNRDELNAEYLRRYNDEFPEKDRIGGQIAAIFGFVEKCGFDERSRAWKKTDLFTLLVELYSAIAVRDLKLDPVAVGRRLEVFYAEVAKLWGTKGGATDDKMANVDTDVIRYLKAATKATNDKYARVDRAEIISTILESTLSKPATRASKAAPKHAKRT
ncbi:MAG: DUF262 domain-containing protein [Thermoguttaceae bacterium]